MSKTPSCPSVLLLVQACVIGALPLSVAAAQGTLPTLPQPVQPPPVVIASPLEEAFFTAAIAGNFDADGRLDSMVLDQGEPVLLQSPETFIAGFRLGRTGRDIATITDTWPAGQEAAAFVSSAGLELISVNGLTGQWMTRGVAGGGWQSAHAVVVGDLDGNGRDDIVGLKDSNQGTGRILFRFASGPESFVASAAFNTSAPAFDLKLLDWDGDGDKEIAAFTSYGIEIYEPDGTPVYSFAWDLSTIHGAVLQVPASNSEELAIVTSVNGSDFLVVLSASSGIEGPFGLGPLEVIAVEAADMDNDTDTDLVFSIQSQPTVQVLYNQTLGSGPKFDATNHMSTIPVGDPTRDPSFNFAELALGEFDRDGDIDILVPVQGSHDGAPFGTGEVPSEIKLHRNDTVDHEGYLATLEETLYDLDENTNEYSMEFLFGPPATPLVPVSGESLALRAVIWRTPDLGVTSSTGASVFTADVAVPPNAATLTALLFATGLNGIQFPEVHGLLIRQVILDGRGDIVREGPAQTIMHASQRNFDDLVLLPTVTSTQAALPSILYYEGDPNILFSGTQGGGSAVLPGLPLWDEDFIWQ